MSTLSDTVALVTGASRGAGRGAAIGLGEAGATVYITGRTARPGTAPLPGTLPETAEAVDKAGGRGIPLICDHRDDAAVTAVINRIAAEQGRIDVLVNSVYPSPSIRSAEVPFWELPLSYWDDLHLVGLRANFVTTTLVAPLMAKRRQGLIVNVSSAAAAEYSTMFGVAHGVAKAALDRMTADMARELGPYDVTVVSLWPGALKSEKLLANPGQLPRDEIEHIMRTGQAPTLIGRVVAALAADPHLRERTGTALRVADLAATYGIPDAAD